MGVDRDYISVAPRRRRWNTAGDAQVELVRIALDQPRDRLERIVQAEVERVVGELVDAELNGMGKPSRAHRTPRRQRQDGP